MRKVADDNPNARVLVRAAFPAAHSGTFPRPPVKDFAWTDLTADGETDMDKALLLVADQLKMPSMTGRALPPVFMLISDGQPTDDFRGALKALMDQPPGARRPHCHLYRP
jgi:uncharacterized protein YegL